MIVSSRRQLLARFAAWCLVLAPISALGQTATAGMLQCRLSGGVGMILIENQALDCVYKGLSGPPQHYIGRLTNVGANIGISGPGEMIWNVVTATNKVGPGELTGDYAGAQGSVAVGAGVGGAILIGGSNKSISLQPVSVSVSSGLNLSAGFGNLNLQYMPVTPPPPFHPVKRNSGH
jgi:hypothetical protein